MAAHDEEERFAYPEQHNICLGPSDGDEPTELQPRLSVPLGNQKGATYYAMEEGHILDDVTELAGGARAQGCRPH